MDVESSLKPIHQDQRQWDYAVGFHPTNLGTEEVVYWVEVHPANDGEIKVVLGKLQFLKTWLRDRGPKLNTLRKAFIWVSRVARHRSRSPHRSKNTSLCRAWSTQGNSRGFRTSSLFERQP